MVVSMTGFGRSLKESERLTVTVEIKTVNHRFCEFYMRVPRQLFKVEDKLKKKLNEHIHRGRVEVYVSLTGEAVVNRKIQVDWKLLDDYHQYIMKIKEKYQLTGDISLQELLAKEEIISIEEEESENSELEELVLRAVEEAAKQLKMMRLSEGEALKKDLTTLLGKIKTRVDRVKEFSPNVVKYYQERLTKRMQDFLSGQVDEARMITEVAVFAEKADIHEELTRLHSHIEQFTNILELSEPIGRKLDFLVQEMNREVNTIGSKANDSTIASEVVELKSFLEKVKEQVQNIE